MTRENLYMIKNKFFEELAQVKTDRKRDSRTDVLNTVTIVLVNGPILLIKHVFLR